jgi:cytochrome c
MKCPPLLAIVAASCVFGTSAAAGTPAPAGDDAAAKRLASERGCLACHKEKPLPKGANAILPAAPSWREIAAKYRGRSGAEEQLVRLVVGGSEPGVRHWKNVASFAEMPPNAVEVSPGEALSLVRWILSR